MQTHVHGAVMALALAATSVAQATSAPCYEPNLGTNLQLTDDSVSQGNPLGFTFPGPGGTNVSAIDISSNGFVWLGSSFDNGCCNGDVNAFVTGLPRIAPLWMDLNPSAGGGVYFNTFAPSPTSLGRAVITWADVPEYGGVQTFTVQLQLLSDGSFTFMFDPNVSNQSHDVLTGCTEGGAAVANPIDFSAITGATPYLGTTNPTILELQSLTCDLAGRSFEFLPNGSGSYLVLDRGCVFAGALAFGRGCPQPAVFYELFDFASQVDLSNTAIDFFGGPGGYIAVPATGFFTGYSNSITTGDDVVTGPFALPFTFSFPGGSTSAIDVSSNGFVWLSTGNLSSRCCNGDPFAFVADGPSIAGLWQDLNPGQGGQIYVDVDPNNTEVHVTWVGVPEFFNTGTNTFQITLRSDNSFRLSWQGVANTGHDCLVGFSEGNAAFDPGSMDLSASLPFTSGSGGTPLRLASAAGSLPTPGANYTMEIGTLYPGTAAGFLAIGLGQLVPGLDLSGLGMQGCYQHITLDATQFLLLPSDPTPFSLAIPSGTWLIGVVLNAQAASLSSGANALGVLTSNALQITIGQ